MDPKHRQAIKSNAVCLKSIDKSKLLPFIEKSKLFTGSMMKDIFDTEEACLIEELPTRGPKAFGIFLKVLEDAGQYEAAKKLKESVGTQMYNSLNANAGQAVKNSVQISNSLNTDINSPCYKMLPTAVGNCLIINNVDFKEKPRHWSDKDAIALHHVFSELNYNVTIKNDLKEGAVHSALKDFASKADLDSCVVIILSYGDEKDNQEIIYGIDGEFVYVREILTLFGNKNPKLYGKPKLFFLPLGNTKTHDTDSVTFHVEKDEDLYKDVFILYFPSEEIEGKSFMREFSEILFKNKTEDLETILRKVMKACPSFITRSVGYGVKGITF